MPEPTVVFSLATLHRAILTDNGGGGGDKTPSINRSSKFHAHVHKIPGILMRIKMGFKNIRRIRSSLPRKVDSLEVNIRGQRPRALIDLGTQTENV